MFYACKSMFEFISLQIHRKIRTCLCILESRDVDHVLGSCGYVEETG